MPGDMSSIPPVILTSKDARHVFRHIVNYPLFVPDVGPEVTRALISGELAVFLDEVARLATLGSRHASALLAYLHMKGAVTGGVDLDRAEGLCKDGARNGDPYSQYVMGWVCRAAGRDAEARDWMGRAAKRLFLPALVDVARFMAGGVGFAEADVDAALGVLWDAHKLGHRMALVYMAELLRKKSASWIRRVVGEVLHPFAIVRVTRFSSRYPLSDRVFVTVLTTKLPLFKIAIG